MRLVLFAVFLTGWALIIHAADTQIDGSFIIGAALVFGSAHILNSIRERHQP